jgi:hypothetical protein
MTNSDAHTVATAVAARICTDEGAHHRRHRFISSHLSDAARASHQFRLDNLSTVLENMRT